MTVRILRGDCREILRTLDANSIDCVVTSPPYWGLRDYGVAGQLGMERTLGEHIKTLVDVFREVRRVIKPMAAVWLNYGDCYATTPNGRSAADTKSAGNDDRTFRDKPFSTVGPIYVADAEGTDRRGKSLNKGAGDGSRGRIHAGGYLKPKDLCLIPFRLAIALQNDGWWVRSRCIWGKPNAMPDSSGRYRPAVAHEEIFLLSKSGDIEYYYESVKAPQKEDSPRTSCQRANGRLLRTYEPEVWHIATVPFKDAHSATFPPALVERCLMATTKPGDTVLDPFGGAGTTGLVADRMGRNAILIELNPAYADIAERRIKREAPLLSEVG